MTTPKAVVVISGGLDSVTLAYQQKKVLDYDVHGISFNYGQRHKKELKFAAEACKALEGTHKIVDLSGLTELFADSGSSLVTDTDVPEGHYGEESMKATVVPNRNMIMMSIAAGYAISIGAERLVMGMHAGDHFIYPDCRPDFFLAAKRAVLEGNQGFMDPHFHVEAPFINMTKNDIAVVAAHLDVPVEKTWSCYKGGKQHCGKCGTCVERIEALHFAMDAVEGFEDKTTYEDTEFWIDALKRDTV
jgi:7-cyano-7-deazaguanine synthase